METIEQLRDSMESTEQMLSVVKTMKALAAVNIREYEDAVSSLELYEYTIEQGLQIVLQDQPPIDVADPLTRNRLGIIVFGSQQGLAGQFNQRIARYTLEQIDQFDDDVSQRRIMTIGSRVEGYLNDGGLTINETARAPSSLQGIQATGQNVLLKIDTWRSQHQIEHIVLFYNAPTSSASYESRLRWMLPIDPHRLRRLQNRDWDSRSLPTYTMEQGQLFSGLIRQLLFVILYRAFAGSLASENASRLQSMQSAESNIEEQLNTLQAKYKHERQSSITAELLDIVAGFEALNT